MLNIYFIGKVFLNACRKLTISFKIQMFFDRKQSTKTHTTERFFSQNRHYVNHRYERNHNRFRYKKREFPKTITWREKCYRKPRAIKTGNNLFIWRFGEKLSTDPGKEQGKIKLMCTENRMRKWDASPYNVITANLLTRSHDSATY